MPKTYTAAGTVVAGEVYTASAHNIIATDVNNLIVPAACSVYHNTTQSIASGTNQTVIFNSELYDTDAMHDNVTANSRITINTPGLYIVTSNLTFTNTSATGTREIKLAINGVLPTTQNAVQKRSASSDGAASNDRISLSTILSLNLSDYVEVFASQSSGGPMNLVAEASGSGCNFTAVWIGRTS
jgi:hypothetical protein